MELIARRIIAEIEGEESRSSEALSEYSNPDTERYEAMLKGICSKMGFTSLQYNRLDDMLDSAGIDKCKMCTYCWDGRE